jgi:hypothetical protein
VTFWFAGSGSATVNATQTESYLEVKEDNIITIQAGYATADDESTVYTFIATRTGNYTITVPENILTVTKLTDEGGETIVYYNRGSGVFTATKGEIITLYFYASQGGSYTISIEDGGIIVDNSYIEENQTVRIENIKNTTYLIVNESVEEREYTLTINPDKALGKQPQFYVWVNDNEDDKKLFCYAPSDGVYLYNTFVLKAGDKLTIKLIQREGNEGGMSVKLKRVLEEGEVDPATVLNLGTNNLDTDDFQQDYIFTATTAGDYTFSVGESSSLTLLDENGDRVFGSMASNYSGEIENLTLTLTEGQTISLRLVVSTIGAATVTITQA